MIMPILMKLLASRPYTMETCGNVAPDAELLKGGLPLGLVTRQKPLIRALSFTDFANCCQDVLS